MDIDTDKTKASYLITKDTAISLAVLLPLVGLFIGALAWAITVHAKVDSAGKETMLLTKKIDSLEREQRAQLDRYIAIEVKLGELKGLLTNKGK